MLTSEGKNLFKSLVSQEQAIKVAMEKAEKAEIECFVNDVIYAMHEKFYSGNLDPDARVTLMTIKSNNLKPIDGAKLDALSDRLGLPILSVITERSAGFGDVDFNVFARDLLSAMRMMEE